MVELVEDENTKSPQEDVETYPESHGDVVTISESPHDAMEDDEDEEEDEKPSWRCQLICRFSSIL